MQLADAVRRGQDLRPLLDLAHWLRRVTGAVIVFSGHASSEGAESLNHNLAISREDVVEFFLFRASADLKNNRIPSQPAGYPWGRAADT
jgi:outer membrane protein OmpA-like peptidoglycan-associated protein